MILKLFVFIGILFVAIPLQALDPSTVRTNNRGIELYQSEQYFESYKKFAESLAEEPFDPFLQMNLGMTFYKNEEKEKGMNAFRAAVKLSKKSNNPDAKYFSHFNYATMLAEEGKIDEALKNFQAALDIRPQDKNVRENIEKMWQSQQGKGKGGQQQPQDKKKPSENKDQDGQGDQSKNDQDQEGEKENEKPKKKPKPFDSKELTKDDVRKILDEIKNQEQKIRAQIYEGKGKDKPREKDW